MSSCEHSLIIEFNAGQPSPDYISTTVTTAKTQKIHSVFRIFGIKFPDNLRSQKIIIGFSDMICFIF